MNTTDSPETTTPARLIDAANDISRFASTDASRCVLNGIHFAPNYTEATDGRIMIRVPYSNIELAEFPKVNTPNELPDCIIPCKLIKEALKNVSGRVTLPVLSTVKVSMNDKVNLATTDLENERIITTKAIDGQYPNTQQVWVWPTTGPTFSIALAGEYLAVIAAYAIKHGVKSGTGQHSAIRFDFTDDKGLGSVMFSIYTEDRRKAEGVLMPMKMQ